ncbi:MAG: DnaJ domain-containing protein [Sporocytophaga sp.]|nr:DnaJ domain-containing protein [Sporocytophaga sp.]
MLIKRFFNILKSNLPKTKLSKEDLGNGKDSFENTDYPPIKPMDPGLKKEAEYYANLEVKYGAGFSEIKVSYKELIRKYHPDKHVHSEEKRKIAEEITRKLNEAYNYFEKKFNGKY